MKGEIIFHNRSGGEIIFKITSEHLWERLYHDLAFLAESGRGVSYVRGGGETEEVTDGQVQGGND